MTPDQIDRLEGENGQLKKMLAESETIPKAAGLLLWNALKAYGEPIKYQPLQIALALNPDTVTIVKAYEECKFLFEKDVNKI